PGSAGRPNQYRHLHSDWRLYHPMSARLLLFLVFLPVVARIFHIPLESTTEFLAAGREAGTTEVTHARGELSQRTSNPKCQNRRMQTDSALAFGVRELAPAFASTGSFESAGSPREISMTNNKFSMPNSQFSNPRILESPLVAGEITQKLEASHVPNVPSCHGCHGLPRLMPRVESGKTLDFIGLPRVPRPFTPLGVGASSRRSRLRQGLRHGRQLWPLWGWPSCCPGFAP